jgi:hypothetical protein
MADKRVIFTIHATNRLLERKISLADISTILKRGARLGDPKTGETLCIYKVGTDQYYTLVIEEDSEQITIITAYCSSNWQVEQYQKVKKHEHSKMR